MSISEFEIIERYFRQVRPLRDDVVLGIGDDAALLQVPAAYQLAVVVDDAWQGVDEVVRGHDLLASTARQIEVANALGLAPPRYAHHPVATMPDGRKLGKRLRSDPLSRAARDETLRLVLEFLGQQPPAGGGLGPARRHARPRQRHCRRPAPRGASNRRCPVAATRRPARKRSTAG